MKVLYLTDIKPDEFNFLQILATQYHHDLHLIGGRHEYRHAEDVTLHDRAKILVNLGKLLNRIQFGERGFFIKRFGLVEQIKPDLIHALSANTWGVIASAIPAQYPVVLTCTGSDIFRFPFQDPRVFQQVKQALQRADLIHVLSAATVDHLATHFDAPREKIFFSPWGINLQTINKILSETDWRQTRASLGFAADDVVLFAPRGIRPVFQPIGDLIEILAPLMLANEKIKLIIMMHVREDQALENKIRQDVARYGFTGRVVYIERFLPHREIISLFQTADVTISLAESDETSLAALEAMYCGTIPVLSETLTYPTVFEDGTHAFFVQNGHITEIRAKLAHILDNLTNLKSVIHEANRQIISHEYDRHQNIHKVKQIYQTAWHLKNDSQS